MRGDLSNLKVSSLVSTVEPELNVDKYTVINY